MGLRVGLFSTMALTWLLIPLVGLQPALSAPAAPWDEGTRPRGDTVRPAFVVSCALSHQLADDPIVHPGRPGASHPHDFFGNRVTDAHTTASDLAASSETSCHIPEDASAYWTPTLYDDGEPVSPRRLSAYYYSSVDNAHRLQPIPSGLKSVTTGVYSWRCTGPAGFYRPDDDQVPPTCPDDMHLVIRIAFRDCWNGTELDSFDHRSHLAFSSQGSCPASHPVAFPKLVTAVHYNSGGGTRIVAGPHDDPSVPHADMFASWDAAAMRRLIRACLAAENLCDSDESRRLAAGDRRLYAELVGGSPRSSR